MFSFGRNSSSVIFFAIAAMGVQFTSTAAFAQKPVVDMTAGVLGCQLSLRGNGAENILILKEESANITFPVDAKKPLITLDDNKSGIRLVAALNGAGQGSNSKTIIMSISIRDLKNNYKEISSVYAFFPVNEEQDIIKSISSAPVTVAAAGDIPFSRAKKIDDTKYKLAYNCAVAPVSN